ncbi:MAG: hypothetical protein JSR15_06560 [Proteobacteria bacterium]|nr:hypothetical protein [Pseudomonadota bacterium]
MNRPSDPQGDGELERALDAALARALVAPALPAGFRQQLRAAVARAAGAGASRAQLRAAVEREHAEQLAALRSGYVRLRQRTLGTLVGAAFAAGLLLNFALPWIRAHYGDSGVFALPAIGAAIGVGLSLRAWWQRSSLARLLP